MKRNDLLVIIVAYNSMRWAERCYNSLKDSSTPCDIITIDNGSTDGTQEYIKTNFPEVEIIQSESNLGFGAANNIGLQRALSEGYEYAYLLNQDAWVLPETFEILISISRNNPTYGVLSPMQMKKGLKDFDEKIKTNTLRYHCSKVGSLVEDLYYERLMDIYDVDFVMAAHWLLTKKCIETVGGFSPTFFLYGEDDNYLHRVLFWRMKIGLVPKAQAVHDRANEKWSKEKTTRIEHYTMALTRVSNPLGRTTIWKEIKSNIKTFFSSRDRQILKHTIQLIIERTSIWNNYHQSLERCSFLLTHTK